MDEAKITPSGRKPSEVQTTMSMIIDAATNDRYLQQVDHDAANIRDGDAFDHSMPVVSATAGPCNTADYQAALNVAQGKAQRQNKMRDSKKQMPTSRWSATTKGTEAAEDDMDVECEGRARLALLNALQAEREHKTRLWVTDMRRKRTSVSSMSLPSPRTAFGGKVGSSWMRKQTASASNPASPILPAKHSTRGSRSTAEDATGEDLADYMLSHEEEYERPVMTRGSGHLPRTRTLTSAPVVPQKQSPSTSRKYLTITKNAQSCSAIRAPIRQFPQNQDTTGSRRNGLGGSQFKASRPPLIRRTPETYDVEAAQMRPFRGPHPWVYLLQHYRTPNVFFPCLLLFILLVGLIIIASVR